MKVLFMRFSMFLVTHIVSYLVERMEQFVGLIPDSRYLVQNQTAVRLVIPELNLGLIPDSRYLVQNKNDVRLIVSEQFDGLIPDSRYLVQNKTDVRLIVSEQFVGLIPDSRYLVQNQTDVRLVISEHFRTSIPDSWYVQKQICDPIPSGLFFAVLSAFLCHILFFTTWYKLLTKVVQNFFELWLLHWA